MKKCPYCAEEIQDEAIVCRYCGRDLRLPVDAIPTPVAVTQSQPQQQTQFSQSAKRSQTQPQIGGLGCLLFAVGMLAVGSNGALGIILIIVGLIILVYALASGKITTFG